MVSRSYSSFVAHQQCNSQLPFFLYFFLVTGYEALVEASCDSKAGAVLRAPTSSQGLAPFCKDTFFGQCRLRVWRIVDGRKEQVLDSSSSTAALEVGGGAWWGAWTAKAEMKEPFKTLVRAPLDLGTIGQLAPRMIKPPGLKLFQEGSGNFFILHIVLQAVFSSSSTD